MNKYLILIAGSPATGKSYLVHEIQKVLPSIFILTPDELKEILADSVGFNDLAEKAKLEEEVWANYYRILAIYMQLDKQFILSEYPFSDKQKGQLKELSEDYGYQIITIRLRAEFETLWGRRKIRDRQNDRHLSHIMSHYHYGDELTDRTQADNLITKSEFRKVISDRGYDRFSLGEVWDFDVTNFDQVDYGELLSYLGRLEEK
ncbi:AAA family ATPase [Tetragenococcus koreensis]|uniref:AAA family ATPase n=1 Tax=Tetragenococcus koreensis TaxID=290335 RepID=UPI001F16E2AF|nr:AAA family ATPase [Tetragenococcus koreensis]MCF1617305.1 AAA family ATPase [Tetragenococcus koreensis]MCF1622990.1 AAA family ATPase [Tetragenococcus koreensis]MCF1627561.1 AAA family ATPase [Tetragenococcus koreensis]MCF1632216.1 AAA family ATPase [Tetragenococcus koreensis]MCF1678128.1 AAA family ATPase [Tetragenococcus koreensis]